MRLDDDKNRSDRFPDWQVDKQASNTCVDYVCVCFHEEVALDGQNAVEVTARRNNLLHQQYQALSKVRRQSCAKWHALRITSIFTFCSRSFTSAEPPWSSSLLTLISICHQKIPSDKLSVNPKCTESCVQPSSCNSQATWTTVSFFSLPGWYDTDKISEDIPYEVAIWKAPLKPVLH